ncbi:MAG: UDP-3-O-(3-hydroxymyristoyl)glucosamine N-acyltransferase [Bacteroidia bacterium]|nr:UDP-3-O-(3-hydroxymyristoyl)glucosamine N-acyltransferase [Bacteroidia bacterium]
MKLTVQEICDLVNGTLEGDPNVIIEKVSKIEEAKSGSVSFLANPKYTQHIYETKASAVIVNNDFEFETPVKIVLIRVKDAYQAVSKLLTHFNSNELDKNGIDKPAYIDDTAEIGEGIYIGAFSYIGKNAKIGKNVKIFPQCYVGDSAVIGDNTVLHSGVKVYSNCEVGSNCTLHAAVVIGGDGFGFAPVTNGAFKKVAQTGNVILEDNIEIGANTSIDRATIGSTIIRKGVKLDNLIQIAHNVEIGENTVIAAQTGIAGSTKIGKNCMIGGQVGIVGHITIADNTKIGAQSGISSNVDNEGAALLGSPAIEIKDHMKSFVVFKKLPELERRILELEKNGNGSNGKDNSN